jgi:hypothetical protein
MDKHYELFPDSNSDDYTRAVKPYLEELYGPVRVPDTGRESDSMFTYMTDTHIFSVKYLGMRREACSRILLAEDEVVASGLMFLHRLKVVFVVGFSDGNCSWEFNRDQYEIMYSGETEKGQPQIKSLCFLPTKYLRQLYKNARDDLETTPRRPPQEAPEQIYESVHEGRVQDVEEEAREEMMSL